MGVDISEAISDEMVISRPEDIRDLMASLDVMLSSIQAGNSVYDSFISDLDRITGKGIRYTRFRILILLGIGWCM